MVLDRKVGCKDANVPPLLLNFNSSEGFAYPQNRHRFRLPTVSELRRNYIHNTNIVSFVCRSKHLPTVDLQYHLLVYYTCIYTSNSLEAFPNIQMILNTILKL